MRASCRIWTKSFYTPVRDELLKQVAPKLRTEESLDTMTVSSRRKGISSFAKLVDGERVSQFCVMGAPVALAEFAEALRYSSALHWSGNEPMRITIAAAYDSRVVHSAAESWILVQPTNDLPHITADEVSFQAACHVTTGPFFMPEVGATLGKAGLNSKVQVGRSVAITGINISDPDAGDQTRWMTLLVAASTGRLRLEHWCVLPPCAASMPASSLAVLSQAYTWSHPSKWNQTAHSNHSRQALSVCRFCSSSIPVLRDAWTETLPSVCKEAGLICKLLLMHCARGLEQNVVWTLQGSMSRFWSRNTL